MRTPARPRRPCSFVRRARGASLLLLAAVVLGIVAPLALSACGGNADPFTGVYWEPSTGRRVEIRKDDDAYWLYYGAARQPYRATRSGDELTIAQPMGGQTTVRPGQAEGTLKLQTAGRTTLLKRLPQHQ